MGRVTMLVSVAGNGVTASSADKTVIRSRIVRKSAEKFRISNRLNIRNRINTPNRIHNKVINRIKDRGTHIINKILGDARKVKISIELKMFKGRILKRMHRYMQ